MTLRLKLTLALVAASLFGVLISFAVMFALPEPLLAGVTCQNRPTGLGGSAPQLLYGFEPPADVLTVVLPSAPLRPDRRTVSTPTPSTKLNGPAGVLKAWF